MTKNIILKQNKNDMNIRDLKIDDIVFYDNKKYRVKGIDPGRIIVRNESERICCSKVISLQPIPITDDLLEKIGAKLIEGIYYLDDGQIAIQVEINHIWNLSINKGIQDYEKKIYYLHQLQHELYDAGIDIKIELE